MGSEKTGRVAYWRVVACRLCVNKALTVTGLVSIPFSWLDHWRSGLDCRIIVQTITSARPVRLTSNVCKTMETSIRDELEQYFKIRVHSVRPNTVLEREAMLHTTPGGYS